VKVGIRLFPRLSKPLGGVSSIHLVNPGLGGIIIRAHVMRLIYLIVIAGLAVGAVPLNNAVAQSSFFGFERNIDLPGGDYRNAPSQGAADCSSTCQAENRCRAWTYVLLTGRCWLKDATPKRVYNTCCISGIKEGAPGRIN
jgi:hypothetical protein